MEDPRITLSLHTACAVLLALDHYAMSAVAPLDERKRRELADEYRTAYRVQNPLEQRS